LKIAFALFLISVFAASLALPQAAAPPAATPAVKKTAPAPAVAKAVPKAAPKTAGTTAGQAEPKAVPKAIAKKTTTTGKKAVAKKGPPAQTWRNRQLAPSSARYKEIQQALAEKGYLKQEPNGVWDSSSEDALKQYQTEKNLPPTGKINAPSLISLGLGPKVPEPITSPPNVPSPPPAALPPAVPAADPPPQR
jgi:hypothetical protein